MKPLDQEVEAVTQVALAILQSPTASRDDMMGCIEDLVDLLHDVQTAAKQELSQLHQQLHRS